MFGRYRAAAPANRYANTHSTARSVANRAVLAFGEFEYLAKRWLRVGWAVDRSICLATITDSWCFLLTQDPSIR